MRLSTRWLTVYATFAFTVLAPLYPRVGQAGVTGSMVSNQAGQYTLSVTSTGHGIVQVDPQKPLYNPGETVMLAATPDPGWLFVGWQAMVEGWEGAQRSYRVPLVVHANGVSRSDKPVETAINFTTLFANVGQTKAFDPATLWMVEVDGSGELIDSSVPFQFDLASNYHATTQAAGTLIFLMKGNTTANAQRFYHLYFDSTGSGLTPPVFPNLVTRSNVIDQGQDSYRLQTGNATYDYHLYGGGFSSIVDRDGNDWADYRADVSGGGGTFRGLPNMRPPPDGYFHPGNNIGTTTVVYQGPLKHTIRTVTTDNEWEVQWEFFPRYARMNVLRRDSTKNYWVLYEGVPGGSLEPQTDTYTLSNGTTRALATGTQVNTFGDDLPNPEWIYFSDPALGRSFFLVHHTDDAAVDSFRLDNADPSKAKMTIFGFGRALSTNTTYLNATPNLFTIGFMDETAFGPASATINAAYRDLAVLLGDVQVQSPGSQFTANPFNFMITGNTVVTATFEPSAHFTLSTHVSGNGALTITPSLPAYAPGDVVTLTATADPDWQFSGWTGDVTATAPTVAVEMDANKVITANFLPLYTIDISVVGAGGEVQVTPQQAAYMAGEVVTLVATAEPGWTFTGWSGDISGTDATATVTMDGHKTVTANFLRNEYTLVVTVLIGAGSVKQEPDKASYYFDDEVTVTAEPAPGWAFTAWGGALSGDANPQTLLITGDTALQASFAQTTAKLTTQVVGQGQVVVNPHKAVYATGETVELLATPDLDWVFAGWSGDLGGAANPASLAMNGDKSVTATFVEQPAVGGELQSDDFNHCAYSTNVWTWIDPLGAAPPPQVTGEEILLSVPGGVPHDVWREGVQAPHLVQQVDNQDFEVMTQFNTGVSERIQLQGLLFKEDESRAVRVNFQHQSDTTYLFVGVLQGTQSPQARAKVAVAGEALPALRVQRAGNNWTVWYRSGTGEWQTEETLSFSHQLVVNQVGIFVGNASVADNPAPAHTAVVDSFINLAKPLSGDDPRANVLPVEVVGQGEVTKNVACGNPVELTAIAAPGWHFVGWEAHTPQGIESLGSANPLTVEFGKGMTVTARFAEDPTLFTVTTAVIGKGSVTLTPQQAAYESGEIVDVVATAALGWNFVGWSGDLTGTANPQTLTLDTNKQITARFGATETGFIVPSPNGKVTIKPEKDLYQVGDEVTLEAEPNSGWEFVEWQINSDMTAASMGIADNPLTITIDGHTTYEPRFREIASVGSNVIYLPVISHP